LELGITSFRQHSGTYESSPFGDRVETKKIFFWTPLEWRDSSFERRAEKVHRKCTDFAFADSLRAGEIVRLPEMIGIRRIQMNSPTIWSKKMSGDFDQRFHRRIPQREATSSNPWEAELPSKCKSAITNEDDATTEK
jgi:hypothetical protein